MDFSNAPDWFKEAILNRFINDSSFMNMSGYNFTHEGFVLPIGIKITIAVVYMVVCVVGLVGNCLVMYVIIRVAIWLQIYQTL
ncbi:Nociceptin receptor [Acipenser ruthenus]|uniref:Nociceptin receptor n=1 Tax=Acipenser ruthenus TaxID=7906 RepID=A0A444UT22_ACIRT|nr:Nociceptin receptor [Acipenser ruthenus]